MNNEIWVDEIKVKIIGEMEHFTEVITDMIFKAYEQGIKDGTTIGKEIPQKPFHN